MRSIFAKILGWFAALLVLAIAGLLATNFLISRRENPAAAVVRRMLQLQLDGALSQYRCCGKPGLRAELERYDRILQGRHYLVDRDGRDVVTGEDRSAIVRLAAPLGARRLFPFPPSAPPRAFRLATPEGGYSVVAELASFDLEPPNPLPYFTWIALLLVSLSYLLTLQLAKPLRYLRDKLARFGAGDLAVRAQLKRRDEFGDVSRAFDEMAERIETLLQAERRLLEDVSHELRSPLARLGFAVELARNSADKDAAFGRIKRELTHLTELVGELVEVTRAEGDPNGRERQRIGLDELVESVAQDAAIEAEARDCHIERRLERVQMDGDPRLMRRAIENVLRNAIRHSPEGTVIDVTLERAGSEAVVSVRDRGPGVPETDLRKIFQPFFRVQDDRSRQTGGVGLGLSIAQRAVHVHHGTIEALNAGPGLRVVLRVPV